MKREIFTAMALVLGIVLVGCGNLSGGKSENRKEEKMDKITWEDLGGKGDRRELVVAGGCFWGVEGYFSKVPGVLDTETGYANGKTENPGYYDLKDSGHVEAVKVIFDPHRITDEELVLHLLRIIDPYSVNRQGNDVGTQYRTGIYYQDEEQKQAVEKTVAAVEREKNQGPFAVEVLPLANYYAAEELHQDYLEKNPGGYCHIDILQGEKPLFEHQGQRESDEELRARIGDLAYGIARENQTEAPFSSPLDGNYAKGIYVDVVSGEPLFVSSDKFNSGCGWPSFSKPITQDKVKYVPDDSIPGRPRIEVRTQGSDAHIGHVFNDGPEEDGGLRYCINGANLTFIPVEDMEKEGYGEYLPLVK